MKNMFYLAAAILFTGWMIGFFLLAAGALIHTLAVIALIFCLQAVITIPKPKAQQ